MPLSEAEIKFIKDKTGYDLSPNVVTEFMTFEEMQDRRKAVYEARIAYAKMQEEEKRKDRANLPSELIEDGIAHFIDEGSYDECNGLVRIEGALLIIAGIMLEGRDKN